MPLKTLKLSGHSLAVVLST